MAEIEALIGSLNVKFTPIFRTYFRKGEKEPFYYELELDSGCSKCHWNVIAAPNAEIFIEEVEHFKENGSLRPKHRLPVPVFSALADPNGQKVKVKEFNSGRKRTMRTRLDLDILL